jgi:hypothetical protein
MSKLSPAAQAVLDAFLGDAENTGLQMDDLRENVAAALRAVVKELKYFGITEKNILAIADELEGQ